MKLMDAVKMYGLDKNKEENAAGRFPLLRLMGQETDRRGLCRLRTCGQDGEIPRYPRRRA